MSDETNWVTSQIEITRRIHPMTDAISTRLAELLNGQLSERQLTNAEALTIAALLIQDIASPTQPDDKEKS